MTPRLDDGDFFDELNLRPTIGDGAAAVGADVEGNGDAFVDAGGDGAIDAAIRGMYQTPHPQSRYREIVAWLGRCYYLD